jgi:hypothetical protein
MERTRLMETELRHCKPEFALEKSRARTGGKDSGPVHDGYVEENLRLMDDLCFIPFRRQRHEVPAMLQEIVQQAMLSSGLGQVIREGVPPEAQHDGSQPELDHDGSRSDDQMDDV